MSLKGNFIFALLISILIGALGVRLYKIDNPIVDWHSWRQGDTASVTRIYLDHGLDLLHPRYHDISHLQTGRYNPNGWRFVEFPIYNAFHYFLVKIFPGFSLEIWGRLLSVFCSLVSTFFVFLIGRRFLGVWGGLLSAFLFAFIPFNIYFSRVILPEPMSVMFALLSVWLFISWFDKSQTISLFLSSVFFALALLAKPYIIFYSVPLVWLVFVKYRFNFLLVIKQKKLWIFALIALIPVFLWRLWMSQYPEGIPFYSWVFNLSGIRFKPSFWYWIFGERLGDMILGVWMVPLFLIGVLSKSKVKECYFPTVLGIAMFAYVCVIAAGNVRHDYYQTLIIPGIVLLVAKGVLHLWEQKVLLQPFAKIAVVVCIIWGLYFPWNQIKGNYQINHPEILKAGAALDKIAPKDALVVAPYNGDTALLYQTKRMGWPIQAQPIEELVSLGADYYLSVNLNDSQAQDAMRKFEISVQTKEFVIIDLNRKRLPKGDAK